MAECHCSIGRRGGSGRLFTFTLLEFGMVHFLCGSCMLSWLWWFFLALTHGVPLLLVVGLLWSGMAFFCPELKAFLQSVDESRCVCVTTRVLDYGSFILLGDFAQG